jgi:hypothetical protein
MRKLTRKRTRDLYANAGRKFLHQQEKKSAHVCIMPVFQRGKRAWSTSYGGPGGQMTSQLGKRGSIMHTCKKMEPSGQF